jgi:hypothetical protein
MWLEVIQSLAFSSLIPTPDGICQHEACQWSILPMKDGRLQAPERAAHTKPPESQRCACS